MARSKGSVDIRGKNRWRLEFVEEGQKYRKTVTAKGEREARKELAKFIAEVEFNGYQKPNNIKFVELVEFWKKNEAPKYLSPKSFETYTTVINLRLIPEFGQMRLNQITSVRITEFLTALKENGARADGQEGGLKGSTINFHRRVLKTIFDSAVNHKYLTDNPVKNIRKEPEKLTAGNTYSEEELDLLYKALEKEDLKWRLYFLFAVTCGLRREELMGLEWKDVDLQTGFIRITQALIYVKDKGYIYSPPKTEYSSRPIDIPDFIMPLLRKYKEIKTREMEILKKDGNWEGGSHFLVFSNYDGKPNHYSYPRTKWIRFIKRNQLRYIRPHDLRHTCATFMLANNIDINTVSARLGHSKATTTLNIYGHATRASNRKAAQIFSF